MVNERKLKAAIVAAGETQRTLAKKIGLLTTSLNYRIHGKVDFRANEIEQISKILNLEPKQILCIFFAPEVDKMPTENIGE